MNKKTPKKVAKKKESTAVIVREEQDMRLTPPALMAQAITQGADVQTMEKLMDLQDRWEAKNAKKSFDEAMATFQAECPTIKKTKVAVDDNKKVLYKFAPLDSVVEQTKHLIQKNGFSYTFRTKSADKLITATCIVKHQMGHSEESSFEVPSGEGTRIMSGPQKVAAALTFAKRYAFCNAFGIMTGDEDIDAAGVTNAPVDQAFKKMLEIVAKTKDLAYLDEYRVKMLGSDKYTDEQKKEFIEAVKARVKESKK